MIVPALTAVLNDGWYFGFRWDAYWTSFER